MDEAQGALPPTDQPQTPSREWLGPCAYCSLAHGNALFPELLAKLAAVPGDGPDPYRLLGMARKILCGAVRTAAIGCDPGRCGVDLDRALAEVLRSDHPEATWGWWLKRCYQGYVTRDEAAAAGAVADLLSAALAGEHRPPAAAPKPWEAWDDSWIAEE